MTTDLTPEELKILLAWAEESTSSFFAAGSVFLTPAEEILIEKLQYALQQTEEQQTPVPRQT